MWLWGTAITAGTGFWSTHFIALLSYRPGLATGYDPLLTLLAWIATILGTGVSLGLLAGAKSWRGRMAGGAALGSAQATTHFIGIAAYRTQGLVGWNIFADILAYLSPVIILAVGLGVLRGLDTWSRRCAGAGLLTLSILVLHFSGMASMSIFPDARVALNPGLITSSALCVSLIMILALSISMSVMALLVRESVDVEALDRLREVISAMPAGLAYYDYQDRLVVWNASYAEMAGAAAPLLRHGRLFRDVLELRATSGLHPEAIGREAEWVDERLERHRQRGPSFEQANLGAWLRIDERRTREGGTICVAVDVTDLKRAAESLAVALAEAERANTAKDQFLATMSHEVRTPLNGVLGLADALAKTGLTTDQRQIVGSLQASASSLSHMLGGILDFVSLNTGRFELFPAPFDLQAMLSEAMEGFAQSAQSKGLTLKIVDRTDVALQPIGDRSRIQQVLISLIDNAIKFTAHGGVRVEVDAPQSDAGGLVISVIDTGVGLTPDAVAVLFETFAQADGSMTRRHGGLGLGLSVSRKLIHLMTGELTAHSVPGQGATFRLILPVPWAAAPKRVEPTSLPPSSKAGAPVQPQTRLRVLLAEDHPTNRQLVELILSTINADLLAVEDGAQAVDAFKMSSFDIVLMDLQMPVMDGLTAMRHIREWEAERHMPRTPVMALTANVLPIDVAKSLASGATSHVGKPVSAAKLLAAIDAAILIEKQSEAQLAS